MSAPAQPSDEAGRAAVAGRPSLVPELIRLSMIRHPDAVAVAGPVEMTYAELGTLAARFAAMLHARGVEPGAFVGICVPKSAAMVAALLAVWDCGAVSVPLPDSGSSERVAQILGDCGARCVLMTEETRALVARADTVGLDIADAVDLSGPAAAAALAPSDAAYVIYTSGSSGLPKGIVMSQGALANVVDWQRASTARTHAGLPPRAVQFTPLTFDVSYLEISACLASGGTLLLPSEEQRRDPVLLFAMMAQGRATTVFLPHVMFHAVADVAVRTRGESSLALRQLMTGGEQVIVTDGIRDWFRAMPGCRLQNIYGPSETHVVTMCELDGEPATWPQLPPIGRAIPGARLTVHDDDGLPVGPGGTGELWISGPCVADGYLHRPELTAQRFSRDQLTGERSYWSGDLVRDVGDGVLHYVRRKDDQIKIRGSLVDPSGVEALLAQHPDVRAAAVVVGDGVGGDKRLIAYIVPRATADVERGGDPRTRQADPVLVRYLLDHLPDWSIPETYVYVADLPVSPSGKIDRKALPVPSRDRPPIGAYRAAKTPTEACLVAIWSRLLQLDDVGTTDRFFDIGGHSLLLARLQTEVSREIGSDIGVAELMEHPTIQDLATYLDDRENASVNLVDWDAQPGSASAPARRAAFRARGMQRRTAG